MWSGVAENPAAIHEREILKRLTRRVSTTATLNKAWICLYAFTCLSCVYAQKPEPMYGGQPESYWMALLTNIQSREFNLHWPALGTNGISVLLKAVGTPGSGQNTAIRTNAAHILSQAAPTQILAALATSSPYQEVRFLALNGLIFKGEKHVTVALLGGLNEKEPKIRRTALMGLALTERERTPEMLPALLKCLQDRDPDIRATAAAILQEPWPKWPGQSEEQVAEAILAEIKRAANNPDPAIRAPAAKALKGREPEIQTYAHELALMVSALHGSQWKLTLKVTDEASNPISDAQVRVIYYVPASYAQSAASSWDKIDGLTDPKGIFVASHQDGSSQIGFSAQKPGYYTTHGGHEFQYYHQFEDAKIASNRNPVVTVALKKVIDPVPMYAHRLDFAHTKHPAENIPLGFDLAAGDWIRPYGKGTNAHMFFHWHVQLDAAPTSEKPNRNLGGETTLTITFPKSGDGIQEFGVPGAPGSELRSPQQAPENGYQPKLLKFSGWHPDRPASNNYDNLHLNYIFRIGTVLDDEGKVKSANYGKIYGDFDGPFSCYLNPKVNSRSLEFDMKTNLGSGGIGNYISY